MTERVDLEALESVACLPGLLDRERHAIIQAIAELRRLRGMEEIPAGWKLAPLGTSWDMRTEGAELLLDHGVSMIRGEHLVDAIYRAMLNAAPSPPAVHPSAETLTLSEQNSGGRKP